MNKKYMRQFYVATIDEKPVRFNQITLLTTSMKVISQERKDIYF